MAKRVGLISINLVAGTAQFNADMGKACLLYTSRCV